MSSILIFFVSDAAETVKPPHDPACNCVFITYDMFRYEVVLKLFQHLDSFTEVEHIHSNL